MHQRARHDPEFFFNIVLMVLGLIVIGMSLTLGFGTLKKPGTGLVPCLAGALIFISALLLVFWGKEVKEDRTHFTRQEIGVTLRMTVVFICWILVMSFLGYLLVTFLVTFCFSKILRLPGWWKPVLLSLGTTLFCYLLFDVWLYMDLPRGILG